MRVIGGEFRSRRLKSVPGLATRPTPDRLRETLFDIVAPRLEGATFLDAYAGAGAVGIEALSRGAAHAFFLECNRAALDALRENLRSLGLERQATIAAGPVLLHISRHRADIVFLDPPYKLECEYEAVLNILSEAPPALAIVQHSSRFALEETYGALRRARVVKQGDNCLSFYKTSGEDAARQGAAMPTDSMQNPSAVMPAPYAHAEEGVFEA